MNQNKRTFGTSNIVTYMYIDGGSKNLDRTQQQVTETRSGGNRKLEQCKLSNQNWPIKEFKKKSGTKQDVGC